jgi:hypothetical protein
MGVRTIRKVAERREAPMVLTRTLCTSSGCLRQLWYCEQRDRLGRKEDVRKFDSLEKGDDSGIRSGIAESREGSLEECSGEAGVEPYKGRKGRGQDRRS